MRAIFIILAYVIPGCQQASKQSISKIGAALKGNAMAFVVHHAVIWYVFAMIPFRKGPFLPADIMLSALICSLHAEMPAASMETRAVRLPHPSDVKRERETLHLFQPPRKKTRFHIVWTCEGMQG